MALFPSNTRKGLGFMPEEGEPTTYGLERLDEMKPGLAPRGFRDHEGDLRINGKRFIFDQQATSSCVANAVLHALVMKERRAGLPFDEPSRLFVYYNGRREHKAHLRDRGTYIRTLCKALNKQGVPSEKYWQWAQLGTKVNRRPSWDAMRYAHPRRGGMYVRIYENGTERLKAIQTALMNGHDVCFGTRVAKSFLSRRGDDRIDMPKATDPIAGNHAMLIIGWHTFDGDQLYFRVLNSWGHRWRDEGLCWMSAEYIAAGYTRDLHVIQGWERLQKVEETK